MHAFPFISTDQQKRDHAGLRDICAACGHPGTRLNPLELTEWGSRVHRRHLDDPASGLYGRQQSTNS